MARKHNPAAVTASTICPYDRRPCEGKGCDGYLDNGECIIYHFAQRVGVAVDDLSGLAVGYAAAPLPNGKFAMCSRFSTAQGGCSMVLSVGELVPKKNR